MKGMGLVAEREKEQNKDSISHREWVEFDTTLAYFPAFSSFVSGCSFEGSGGDL